MVRTIVLALLSLLLGPAVAAAALPPANPPDVARLKAKGVQVDWPLTANAELSAVHTVTVKVRSRTPVTLSLVTVGRNGRPLRSVAHKTLRRGTVEHAMAYYRGKRLALRLDVGKRRYWSWIIVTRAVRRTLTCEHGAETPPTLQLGLAPRSGHAFAVGLRNAGRCPLGASVGDVQWLRPTPAGWEPVPVDCATNHVITPQHPSTNSICDRIELLDLIGPGGASAETRRVPTGLPPGRYLVRVGYRSDLPPLQAEVDVVA